MNDTETIDRLRREIEHLKNENAKLREEKAIARTESEERWSTLFKNAPDFILILDKNNNVEFVNRSEEAYTKIDFEGKQILDLIGEESREDYSKLLDEVREKRSIRNINHFIYDSNGEKHWLNDRISPVVVNNEVVKIIVFSSEITALIKMSEELTASRNQLQAITNAMPDIIFILDGEGTYIDIFTNNEELLFDLKENVIGKKIIDILPNDVGSQATEVVQKTIETKRSHFFDYKLEVIGGSSWFEGHTSFLEYFSAPCCIFLARDITKRKEAELDLADREERLRDIFENAPIGLYRSKPSGNIVYANPYLIDMMEFNSLEEMQTNMLTGDSYANKVDREQFRNIIETYGIIEGYEVEWKTKSGKKLIINEHSRLVIDHKTNERFYDGLIENVTERRRHEIALEESERKFRSIFENAPIGIFRATPDGKFVECNKAFIKMLGYESFLEIVESEWTIAKQFFIDETTMLSQLAITLENKKLSIFENIYKRKDGSIFTGILRLKPVFDQSNDYLFLEGLVEDITERKMNEEKIKRLNQDLERKVAKRTEQLERANDKLESTLIKERELNVMKSRFISMISHEYRTPLTIILSSTNLISKYSKTSQTDEVENHLDKIQNSVKLLTYLLEDVITFAQSEEDSIDLNIEKVNISMIIQSFIEEMIVIDNNSHPIEFQKPKGKLNLRTDKKLLRFILINLLSNACKFSKTGKKVVVKLENSENEIKISVIDNGNGISKNDLPHIFTPFYRHKDTIGSVSGHGLGLAIVQRYTNALNGRVEVESELFKGSNFVLHLPKQPGVFIEM